MNGYNLSLEQKGVILIKPHFEADPSSLEAHSLRRKREKK